MFERMKKLIRSWVTNFSDWLFCLNQARISMELHERWKNKNHELNAMKWARCAHREIGMMYECGHSRLTNLFIKLYSKKVKSFLNTYHQEDEG